MKDSELIKKIKQGETELLDVLIEGHYDGIYRFCYYKTGDREAAYDCAQETFLHLLRYLDTYVEQKKFKAYLYRIAGNVCTDWFRKNSVQFAGEELLEILKDPKQAVFFYTPVGLEVGLNYESGWVTVTLKEQAL